MYKTYKYIKNNFEDYKEIFILKKLCFLRIKTTFFLGGGLELKKRIYSFFGIKRHTSSIVKNSFFKELKKFNNCCIRLDSPMSFEIAKMMTMDKELFLKIKEFDKNLNQESRILFYKIVSRLLMAYQNPNRFVFANNYEKNELKNIQNNFFPEIFKLEGDNKEPIFCYKGYFLPIRQFEISVFFNRHGLYLFEEVTLNNIRNKDIIDVGGFVGDSAIFFEKEISLKNIYSFEATRSNYDLMLKTLKLNDSSRIIPINKGLGSKNEILNIAVNGGGSSLISASINGDNIEQCEIITLDDFVKEHNIEIGFIKVDIEGFEQEFLKGAINTIKAQKPAMLISIYHNYSDFFQIKPLIESWDLGYKFKIFKPVDGDVSTETALMCEVI
ncbi:FkbM family methyltransferase [Campylobacter coli]|nr:FkbM family methyltransferase [Campylobacter coli]